MKGDLLPDEDDISRYCKTTAMGSDNLPLSNAFEPRSHDDHLSVNWLQYFNLGSVELAIDSVREAFTEMGFGLAEGGRFAVLNVGLAKAAVLDGSEVKISILHWPDDDLDPSHSGIFGFDANDLKVAVELKGLVSKDQIYSARA